MTNELIHRRFFATLKYGRSLRHIEQPRSVKQLLMKVYQFAYTYGYYDGMEVRPCLPNK